MQKMCGLLVMLVLLIGCKVENAPSRAALKEAKSEQSTATMPHEVAPTRQDEAQMVVSACGQAASDVVLPIYDKLDNGPVRRMTYRGVQPVVVEFVPTVSESERAARHGQPRPPLQAALPAGAVWEFSEARMEQEELLSSARLKVYLPCAAKALSTKD